MEKTNNAQSSVNAPVVAIYLRVSTQLQTQECQRPDVMALCTARGWTVAVTYEERASAAKHRPQFEQMMADARAGKFSVLVVWALDRFGRSLEHNVRDLMALDRLGVKVVSVKEQWMDTSGPIRELLISIFSWVAQQERTRLIERTKAGIAVARAAGKQWGRPSKGLRPAEERAAIMEQWKDEGKPDGYAGLAACLGCASPTTARKLWLEYVGAPLSESAVPVQNTETAVA